MDRDKLIEWCVAMKLARRAAALATENARATKRITDPLESAILLYTDDPFTGQMLHSCADLAVICNVSAIEGICMIRGENFPSAAFEAERDDLELPRIAALWFPPQASKCPRCRLFTRPAEADVCPRCTKVVATRSPDPLTKPFVAKVRDAAMPRVVRNE